MPSSRSSSSLNTRVFTPTVILQQDTRRLEMRLRSTAGNYTIFPGITLGDCIYYDPVGLQYNQARALDTEAEVIGVVESISDGEYTVVIQGSINYPQARISAISGSEDGKLDVLFLDNGPFNPGGLTGQVRIPSGTDSAIVKPVLQLAPHVGDYNAIVLNYLGYKIGNSAPLQAAPENVGEVKTLPDGANPGDGYLKMNVEHTLSVEDNPMLYSIFGIDNGSHTTRLTMSTAGGVTSTLIGKTVTQSGSVVGTVTSISGNTVFITRTKTMTVPTTGRVYINSIAFNVTSTNITEFSTPVKSSFLVGATKYDNWLNITPLTRVTIPQEFNTTSIVSEALSLGNYSDVEATLNSLQQQINEIKSRIGM
jgi:hypothetical protein